MLVRAGLFKSKEFGGHDIFGRNKVSRLALSLVNQFLPSGKSDPAEDISRQRHNIGLRASGCLNDVEGKTARSEPYIASSLR
jgi:hypothetical protein